MLARCTLPYLVSTSVAVASATPPPPRLPLPPPADLAGANKALLSTGAVVYQQTCSHASAVAAVSALHVIGLHQRGGKAKLVAGEE